MKELVGYTKKLEETTRELFKQSHQEGLSQLATTLIQAQFNMVQQWEDELAYNWDTPWGIPKQLSMAEISKEFGVPLPSNQADTLLDTKMVLISHARALYATSAVDVTQGIYNVYTKQAVDNLRDAFLDEIFDVRAKIGAKKMILLI